MSACISSCWEATVVVSAWHPCSIPTSRSLILEYTQSTVQEFARWGQASLHKGPESIIPKMLREKTIPSHAGTTILKCPIEMWMRLHNDNLRNHQVINFINSAYHKSWEVMAEEKVVLRRKPRASATIRYLKKLTAQITSYGLPIIRWGFTNPNSFKPMRNSWQHHFLSYVHRYSLMPGLLFASIYYTEPQPTLLELINPFF